MRRIHPHQFIGATIKVDGGSTVSTAGVKRRCVSHAVEVAVVTGLVLPTIDLATASSKFLTVGKRVRIAVAIDIGSVEPNL